MRVAAIDCGTNSLRLLVAEERDGQLTELVRDTTIVRLGQGVDATGEFAADALERTFAVLDRYATVLAEFRVDATRMVATSAARDARNRAEFFTGVRSRLGIDAEVIDGAQEARLSFAGASSGLPEATTPLLVIDIGGGSTELIRGHGTTIEQAQSLDMGAVRLRERYLHDDPPTADQIAAARAYVDDLLDHTRVDLSGIGTFVGVAGTVTSMAAVVLQLEVYDRTRVHRTELELAQIDELAGRWLSWPIAQIAHEPSMHPQRAEVISGGALILQQLAHRVGRPLVVSERDILDGILADLVARN